MFYYKDKKGNHYAFKQSHEDDSLYLISEEEFNQSIDIPELNDKLKAKIEIEDKINELQAQLDSTDFKAIKFAEGLYTEEEYAPIKEQRQSLRNQINELKSKL